MHSVYSHDGKDSLETMRDDCIERGIQFVGMTDHAEDFTEDVFEEYVRHCDAVSDPQVTFIPGLEFRFPGLKGMHLLALGLRTWITPRSPEQFIDMTRGTARLTVLAHPILARYQIPQVVLDQIDGIEVWNANYNTRYLPDPQSITIVQTLRRTRPSLVATVGLDQHDSSNDRGLRILVASDAPDPLGEIHAGRFTNLGHKMTFDAAASLTSSRMRRLRVQRRALDAVDGVHERIMRAIRRLEATK